MVRENLFLPVIKSTLGQLCWCELSKGRGQTNRRHYSPTFPLKGILSRMDRSCSHSMSLTIFTHPDLEV